MHDRTSGNLLEGPVFPALVRMALPASIGYFFNTMYNVVDTYWAGRLSTDALAGLSLTFPVFAMLLAVAVGTAAGSTALISNYIGAGHIQRSRQILAQALSFGVVLTAVAATPLLLVLRPFLAFLGGGDGAQESAFRYAQVLISGGVFFVINQVWNSGLQARGDTRTYRNILIISFFVNIGLDPLLMLGWHPGGVTIIPALGVRGIALATVLVQAGGIFYVARRGRRLGILQGVSLREFIPRLQDFKEIAEQALPGALNFLTMALGSYVITAYIGRFGTSAVAGYGAALRIEQMALVPTIGINIALATMVGQSNGAGRFERIRASYRTTLLMGLAIFALLYPWVFFFGHHLIALFNDDPQVMAVGHAYLRTQAVTFFSYVILFQANSILQGLKRPGAIFYVGMYRQLAAPLLVFPFLAFTLNMQVNGVWWGLVVVNWSAAVFSYWWSWHRIRVRERTA